MSKSGIKRGGISYTQAVDVAPMKRFDESLKNIALAAFSSSFNNKKSASNLLNMLQKKSTNKYPARCNTSHIDKAE